MLYIKETVETAFNLPDDYYEIMEQMNQEITSSKETLTKDHSERLPIDGKLVDT